MRQILAYKAIDGRVFESMGDAKEHERTGILAEKIESFMAATDVVGFDVPTTIKRWEEFKTKHITSLTIDQLDLTFRIRNCLQAEDITTVEQLLERSENELLKTPNFGRKSLKELVEKLETFGLSLRSTT